MCYFSSSPLARTEQREIDDAIVGWKKLTLGHRGNLVSPMQGTAWEPTRPMTAGRPPRHRVGRGIYAFKEKRGARGYSGNVVVKLLLWGTVLCYDARRAQYARRPAGYIAQYAEIHEIHIPRSAIFGQPSLEALVDVWGNQGVKIVQEGQFRADDVILVAA